MLRARHEENGRKEGYVIMIRFKGRRKGRENALCLGDELMKLADEILEDELCATAHRRDARYTRDDMFTYGFGASSVSLSRLAVMTSGLSGY